MIEQERANALVTVLTKLTLGNVALGLALGAGAVLVWGQVNDMKAGAITLLGAIIIGSLLVSIGSAMWGKLESLQTASDTRWQRQVDALQVEIDSMRKAGDEGRADRADLRDKLAACEARDRATQARMSRLEKQITLLGGRTSDFGDLGG